MTKEVSAKSEILKQIKKNIIVQIKYKIKVENEIIIVTKF